MGLARIASAVVAVFAAAPELEMVREVGLVDKMAVLVAAERADQQDMRPCATLLRAGHQRLAVVEIQETERFVILRGRG